MTELVQIVNTVGFPIAMCGIMGYYLKYTHDDHRKDIQRLQDNHKEEIENLAEVITNNTAAINQLTLQLSLKEEDKHGS